MATTTEEEFVKRTVEDDDNETSSDEEGKTHPVISEPIISEPKDDDDDDDDDSNAYLGPDPALHGQSWACVSFASSGLDTFAKIELRCIIEFILYLKSNEPYSEDEKGEQKKALDLLLEQPNPNDAKAQEEYAERMLNELPQYYGNYIKTHKVKLGRIVSKIIGDKKRVERAFKIRGCFKTSQKAERYAKDFLSKVDKVFPVHICRVGHWVPFDPTINQIQEFNSDRKELDNLINNNKKERQKNADAIEIRKQAAYFQAKKMREEYQKKKEDGTLPDIELDDDTIKKIRKLEMKVMKCSMEEQEEMREDAERRYALLKGVPYYKGIMGHIFDAHMDTSEIRLKVKDTEAEASPQEEANPQDDTNNSAT